MFHDGYSLDMPFRVVANHQGFTGFFNHEKIVHTTRGSRKRVRKRKSLSSTIKRPHSNGTQTGGGGSKVTTSLTIPQIWERLGNQQDPRHD